MTIHPASLKKLERLWNNMASESNESLRRELDILVDVQANIILEKLGKVEGLSLSDCLKIFKGNVPDYATALSDGWC